jgi:excinuclease ABC subunit C
MLSRELKIKAARAPEAPGVYLFKDSGGKALYVGKARDIKQRLKSYFGRDLSGKTLALMGQAADLEFRVTASESMALLLEASLIQRLMPKYNISLPNDKSFPWVKITDEDFPVVSITRKREPDGSRYFGPYISANLLRQALRILRGIFPYRSCRKMPKRACIYYRLHLSPGPCEGRISRAEYARTIARIVLVLEGKGDRLIKRLAREMNAASAQERYEEAARLRDQVNALSGVSPARSRQGAHLEAEDLMSSLKLGKMPWRIEAFDVSNISGQEATGSMVSFFMGRPDKDNYRKFRIRSVKGPDDYAMIKEVVRRRYSRVLEEKLPLPDLVLIDGGKGHLLSAKMVLDELGLDLPLASIAKAEENIYLVGRARPVNFSADTPGLNLLRRVRDEAHRFAVAYHHVLRRKKVIGR